MAQRPDSTFQRSGPFAALATACLLAAGCGLFQTSEPEPPTSGGGPPPNFAVRDSTLATLIRSVHDRNTTNYGLCFADTLVEHRDFHASFDPSDITDFTQSGGVLPGDWNRDREISFFPQFVAFLPNARYDVYFFDDPDRDDVDLGGPTQIHISNLLYRVWSAGTPVAVGSVGLTFERVGLGGDVKITFWEDRRDSAGVRTWGRARLNGQ